ncbi:MAG: hypothetical protein CMJ81_21400 [Planctomycetaceae bacterium]|nr:hypothetical protein [Planctomycetaceae bacterium]MBP63357.1 hypothetical protein [Planctomycetaceae bacterium]
MLKQRTTTKNRKWNSQISPVQQFYFPNISLLIRSCGALVAGTLFLDQVENRMKTQPRISGG